MSKQPLILAFCLFLVFLVVTLGGESGWFSLVLACTAKQGCLTRERNFTGLPCQWAMLIERPHHRGRTFVRLNMPFSFLLKWDRPET